MRMLQVWQPPPALQPCSLGPLANLYMGRVGMASSRHPLPFLGFCQRHQGSRNAFGCLSLVTSQLPEVVAKRSCLKAEFKMLGARHSNHASGLFLELVPTKTRSLQPKPRVVWFAEKSFSFESSASACTLDGRGCNRIYAALEASPMEVNVASELNTHRNRPQKIWSFN